MKLGGSFLALFLAGVLEAQMPDYDTLVAIHGELEDASTAKSVSELETRLAAIDISSWERSEKVDYLLVVARLAGKDFELRVMRPRSRDPLRYIDRMRRVAYEDVPVSDVAAFRDRLRGVRKIVTEAQVELTEPSAELARLAIRHLEQHDGVGQGEPVRHPQPAGIIGWYRHLDARAVRIPAELAMQTGEMSLDEAIRYMVDLVPYMEEDLARYDLQIYLRRPAYGMNYTIGMAQIEELLAREALRLRGDFDLGVFHDTFLSKGMIPIALIGWEMSGDDEAYAWLLPD